MAERAGPVHAVVVAAMPEETGALRRMLGDPWPIPGRTGMVRGWLGGRRVLLATTGDGAMNAAVGSAEALNATRARALIAIGVAGALSSELRTGELVSVHRAISERDGTRWEAAPPMLAAAVRFTRAVTVSAERIADTLEAKRRLLAFAQPEPGVAAIVDLESTAFARAAQAAGVPWLILRAISDTASEELPALFNQALQAGGAVDRRRVLTGLLRQPSVLPALLGLRRRVRACAEVLAAGVEVALRSFAVG